MPRILAYIMDHDYGNAPRIENNVCELEECKGKTIVKSAQKDDWIIAFGGRELGRSKGNANKYFRKLIYAMKVEETNPPSSRNFSFFGEKAIDIPDDLLGFIFQTNWGRGAKYFSEKEEYDRIEKFLLTLEKGEIGCRCDYWGKQEEEKTEKTSCDNRVNI